MAITSTCVRITIPVRIFTALLLAALAASPVRAEGPLQRSWLSNHYIVLFDASGSMKKMASAAPPIWQIMKKALYAPPSEFPRFTEHDYFSFLFFSLDWSHPSYRLEDMFLTNKDLRLVKGFPRSPEPFGREVYPRKPFSGHSPLIAATTVALPYLGMQAQGVQGEIGKTIIVRVTDGQYNTLSNGADEFRAIRQTTQVTNHPHSGWLEESP